jgi:hypothetical protein
MADPKRNDDANRVGVYDDTTETSTQRTTGNTKGRGVGTYDRPKRTGSPAGAIIGIVLFIIIAIAIYFFFFRQPRPGATTLDNSITETQLLEEPLLLVRAPSVTA